jgi:hypothetical protein
MGLDIPAELAVHVLRAMGFTNEHLQGFRRPGGTGSANCNPSQLPEGALEYLVHHNPRLESVRRAYAGHPAAAHVQWTETFLSNGLDLRYFRADNVYLWQKRGLGIDLRYLATAYHALLNDPLGLCERLREDDLFGMHTVLIDEAWTVSRDLLDSINQINALSRLISVESIEDLVVLDIGAGYGRFAHRLCEGLDNVSRVLCTDAVAESTFLCEYYLRFRGVRKAAVVPLDEIAAELGRHRVLLAVNFHSFSECSPEVVDWWIALLRRHGVRYLFVEPNEVGGPRTITGAPSMSPLAPGADLLPVFEKHGYRRTRVEPKYKPGLAQTQCIQPTHYHLFELESRASASAAGRHP